ncbi:hypothetical protein KC222_15465 [Cedecea davisae]|uniref:Uncharacterized protein n=1 Tax=Cedecea davisae TaxID=158484 RepID=A0ABS6DJL5_9ENTR|nr:hypothetical protein [Cedecea davisae]MBU4683407.1 hypothetical protein [Cedecea davisae]MBU4685157.1 hypothetical protein [Cedecea davisae]
MPNTVLEMSPLARSSHSIHIDDLPSLPPDSDKKNSPLASRLTRVNNSASELSIGVATDSESEVEFEHKQVRFLNVSEEEIPPAASEERSISWKGKVLFALSAAGTIGLVLYMISNRGSTPSGEREMIMRAYASDIPIALP